MKWQYNEETGEVLKVFGNPLPRNGLPPCLLDSCPKGRYDNQWSLLPINYVAFKHYLRCKAVNQFPDDEIVKENALIISRTLAKITEDQNQLALVEAQRLKANG